MDNIIVQKVTLNCDAGKAFEMFTVNENLQKWLTAKADVEPKIGGKYELFWNPTNPDVDSTKDCKILAIERPNFINFEWKGASQHRFMNDRRPLTNVTVFFIAQGGTTEIVIIHTGWENTQEWEKARDWFEIAWKDTTNQLKQIVNS